MQVAQVVQCRFVFVAHSARKVRIAQAPLRATPAYFAARQASAESPAGAPTNLSPLRQHIFLICSRCSGVILPPGIFFRAQICPVLPIQVVPLIELLPDAALLLWSKVLKCFAVL